MSFIDIILIVFTVNEIKENLYTEINCNFHVHVDSLGFLAAASSTEYCNFHVHADSGMPDRGVPYRIIL